jgi:hypothetical protein
LFNGNDSPTAICNVIHNITWKDHPENGTSVRSWKEAAITYIKIMFKEMPTKRKTTSDLAAKN